MGDLADIKKKIEGHRKSIREHQKKYADYALDREKETAWKTIQRVQKLIAELREGHEKNLPAAEEDTWKPNKK